MLKNQIRIIGGEWRSRQISFYDVPGLRPTPARVRETLFNWLQYDIPGSRCLDLYAGSGALGFEAASRGAKAVVQVEQDANVCRALHENAIKLNAKQIKIVQTDVFRFLAENNAEPFDIVFLDPPFGKNLAIQTCNWLEDKSWLNQHTKIYVETESKLFPVNLFEKWQLLKSKTAGEVSYHLFKKNA
jgi:16S rRNA (guanine966-N2)-methyltransferase